MSLSDCSTASSSRSSFSSMSSDKPWTAREVDKCAEHGLCGGFAVGGLWCCPVSRGEDEERCTVSFRLTSRRNAELCLVSCVGVVGDEEIPEVVPRRPWGSDCRLPVRPSWSLRFLIPLRLLNRFMDGEGVWRGCRLCNRSCRTHRQCWISSVTSGPWISTTQSLCQ